jgi:hypothetical protein
MMIEGFGDGFMPLTNESDGSGFRSATLDESSLFVCITLSFRTDDADLPVEFVDGFIQVISVPVRVRYL